MSEEFPKIRDLEAFPYSEEGKSLIMLRDPSQMAEGVLVVAPEVYSIFPLFNGRNSLLEIQVQLTRIRGELVFQEQIEDLLAQLDKAHFLENERFHQHCQTVTEQYHMRKVRPAFHAGVSYPSEKMELVARMAQLYTEGNGAGVPGSSTKSSVRALVAPHIDLRLGGDVYTHAYRVLAESSPPDLFVIIGTSHSFLPHLFSLSHKDFETPLGVSRVDPEFYGDLRHRIGPSIYDDDLVHRSEHTIEFQILFLQHLFPDIEVKIIPVLASFSFLDLQDPEGLALVRRFVSALEATEQACGKRVCYIASVDLAHMGPRYGDSFQPDQAFIDETSRQDMEMLGHVIASDPEGFLDYIRSEEDRRRICGFSPLYTLLNLMGEAKGQVLCHSHCKMDNAGSFVTYASLAFHG